MEEVLLWQRNVIIYSSPLILIEKEAVRVVGGEGGGGML